MNRKDHCVSREPLVINADIFHYRQSASKKKKERKKIKKLTNTKTQEQTYTRSFPYFYLYIYIFFIIYILNNFQNIISINLDNQYMLMFNGECDSQ